tara:strand:+ start:76 stop:291 length:216 start_codon:yes stop_codon:yes gene_type:complete
MSTTSNIVFEKGYPKKIYFPHFKPPQIFRNNSIIVCITKSIIEDFKTVYNSLEENEITVELNKRKKLKVLL